jgi:EAL domain-containing protein (putative c-di-GMP-specific phosphodiesterase class I)/GGDEF domain-containing protein
MEAVRQTIGEDQRQSRRLEVLQAASLKTAAGQQISCEIRNFCSGGLFLQFGDPEDIAALDSRLPKGETLEISFTPPVSVSPITYSLKARVVRHSSDGAGVAFIETPVEVIRALNKISEKMRTKRSLGEVYQGQDRKALQESCANLLLQAFQGVLDEFCGLIESRISAAAEQSSSIEERDALMVAHEHIRLQEEARRRKQQDHLLQAYRHYLETSINHTAGDEEDPSGFWLSLSSEINKLVLFQDEEFEDWLNLTTEINLLESAFRAELENLAPRLEKLYGRALDHNTNPFSPRLIGHALKRGFDGMPLSLNARHVVHETLGTALAHPLSGLYRQLDCILPQADRPAQLPVARPQAALTDRSSPPTVGGVASTLMGLFRNAQRAGRAETREMGAGTAPEVPQAAPPAEGAVIASPGMLRAYQAAVENLGQSFDSASRRALEELVGRGKIQPGQVGAAQGVADVFGALTETIEGDASLPASVKQTIKQLQEPLLKLAVLDPGFLNSAQHPAHLVLNAVDRLAMVSSDDGLIKDQKLLLVLQHWVDRIRSESDSNPGIYEETRNHLEKMLQPLMRKRNIRITRTQAGLEGWQKMGQANRTITQNMQRRIEGRKVPDVVMEFFNPGWRNYLIRVLMRQGPGSPEETEAWQAVDRLLEWMDPELSERPPFHEVQRLLTYIDSKLNLVSAGKDVQERLLERLADGLSHPDKGHFKLLVNVKAGASEQQSEPTLEDEDASKIEQFRVGDWFSFATAATPLNLIWIGDDPGVYVFANYQGVHKLELKRQEFLDQLKSGEAKCTDSLDLPLMDRSFSSMIELMHRSLVKQATSDPDSGLMRHPEFMRQVKRVWLHADSETPGYVLGVIDIEDLRMQEVRIGRDGYQKLLSALTLHLKQKCTTAGFMARTGERVFTFMRPCPSQEEAQGFAENIITHISQFGFEWRGEVYTLTSNIGLAWTSLYDDPETFYNKADIACLSAKHEGRNQWVFHCDEDASHKGHASLEYWGGRFNSILSSGKLYLRAQPIVSLAAESAPSHYEILLGAVSDDSEPIQIGDFVAAIERLKRISELDQWVVKEVFNWIRSHPQQFEQVGAFSINLSGPSVNSKSFFSFMEEELGRGDIPCHKLIFEITESAAIDSFVNAEQFIKEFRRYGCRFSLDDFGVGFSSFTYLKNLKVDYLKIDGSFIRDMHRNEVDVALVSSMHETSRFLGIKTIAESVENEETLEQLKAIGVNYVQGYLTGKPMHIKELSA